MIRPAFRAARATTLALAAVTILWPALARASATFVIQNRDAAGEGFNDPTPVAPVGGNTGTTLGQQRLNAFKQAAGIWGTMIDSTVPIVIAAEFSPLACNSSSIELGQAGAASVEINQPGSPVGLIVPEALADRLAGFDINPGMEDIDAEFNGALSDCTGGEEDWYYGFDSKPTGNDLDLISVLLHEFGHGLGFVSEVDHNSGALLGGYVDVFTAHLYDNQVNLLWSEMTSPQRATSTENVRHLVWQGDNVAKMAPMVLAKGAPRLTPSPAPSGFVGALAEAIFGPLLSAGSVQGSIAVGSSTALCAGNPGNYQGKIVVFQGGVCASAGIANIAQGAGAIAVLFSDPDGVAPPSSIEVPPSQQAMFPVGVPVIGVTDGDAALLVQGESVLLDADKTRLVGADAQGRVYMYASNPIIPLSTVSHWDPLARPNLMQEPNDSYIISHDLRMEAALMKDIGWAPFCGNAQIDQQEQCDNGASNSDTVPGACRTTCVKASCGDGVVDPGEDCDNGAANATGAACDTQCHHGASQTGTGGTGGTSSGTGGTSSGTGGTSSGTGGTSSGTGGAPSGTGGAPSGTGGTSSGTGGTPSGTGGTTGGTGPGQTGGGGCACAVESPRPGAPLVLFVGLGLIGVRRRRSRSR